MKYLFYAIVFDVAGNTTAVGSSASPAKTITTNIQKVTGISINPSSAQTKNIGDTFKITATVSPSDANNKSITWSSSSTSVATVDSSGNVHCLAAGTTTITATAADGSGKSASLELTVRNPINSLTLDKNQTTILKDGYTSTVTATTDPSNYDGANISWTIADTSIATVSVSGKTATIKSTSKIGQTTLTVSAGGITKTITIKVVAFTTQTFNYTGTIQSVDLPAGKYKLECWGAQGGNSNTLGGKGGYSVGNITFANNITLYVHVGMQGVQYGTSIIYNGGGAGGNNNNCASGGGATDISLLATSGSSNWNNSNHLYSRIIVAGGGRWWWKQMGWRNRWRNIWWTRLLWLWRNWRYTNNCRSTEHIPKDKDSVVVVVILVVLVEVEVVGMVVQLVIILVLIQEEVVVLDMFIH